MGVFFSCSLMNFDNKIRSHKLMHAEAFVGTVTVGGSLKNR